MKLYSGTVLGLTLLLQGCAMWGEATPDSPAVLDESASARNVPASQRAAARERTGSLKDLIFAPGENDAPRRNLYLWDASLDVLARFPLQTVNPDAGLLMTEVIRINPQENYTITVRVDGDRLTARTLVVSVAKTLNGQAVAADPSVAAALKAQIMARAQELRAQRSTGR